MRRMTPYEIEWYEENKNKPNHPAAFITPGYASKHICLARAPLLSFLSVESEPRSIYSPFVSPLLGYIPGVSEESRKKTLGSKIPRSDYKALIDLQESGVSEACAIEDGNLPPDNPLVLYRSAEGVEPRVEIRVDSMLSRYLREHQRQGVQFVFNCLMGLKDFNGNGCILADDMGSPKQQPPNPLQASAKPSKASQSCGLSSNRASATFQRRASVRLSARRVW